MNSRVSASEAAALSTAIFGIQQVYKDLEIECPGIIDWLRWLRLTQLLPKRSPLQTSRKGIPVFMLRFWRGGRRDAVITLLVGVRKTEDLDVPYAPFWMWLRAGHERNPINIVTPVTPEGVAASAKYEWIEGLVPSIFALDELKHHLTF